MFSAERIRRIKELLFEYKQIDVNTLCSCLSTSVSTIRRDLDRLEAEGFLRRVHGGAILSDQFAQSDHILTEQNTGVEEAEQIAHLAAKIITPDDIIFLGGGHACIFIAQLIRESFHGTVYTNNLEVANTLYGTPQISIILLGGKLTSSESEPVTDTDPEICCTSNIFVSKAFFSVSGVTKQHGYFVNDMASRRLIEGMSENAVEIYILLEAFKTERIGTVRLGSISLFSRVISPSFISDDYKQLFYNNNVTLYTSLSDF